jgi:hypothetical protein
MARISVGPVVGLVTSTSIRLLIELDTTATIKCTVSDAKENTSSFDVSFTKDVPVTFTIAGLAPDTPYTISFGGIENATHRKACVRTFHTDETIQNITSKTRTKSSLSVRVIALSNNVYDNREQTDLWVEMQNLLQKAKQKPKRNRNYVVLHLGNQVDATETFQYSKEYMALEIEKSMGDGDLSHSFEEELRQKVIRIWREVYRVHYNIPSVRYVVSHASNLMIGNDREFTEGWGYLPTHNQASTMDVLRKYVDKNSQDFYVATIARTVYWEYQRSLWDDSIGPIFSTQPEFVPEPLFKNANREHEGFLHVLPSPYNTAILFIDQIFARTFSQDNTRSYLGTSQWQDLLRYFDPEGPLKDTKMLVVATTVPLLFLNDLKSEMAKQIAKCNELRDHWAHGTYKIELLKLIHLLDTWQQSNGRKVLVIAGELSIGGYSTLYRKQDERQLVLQQVITSPITDHVPKWVAHHLIRRICETEIELSSDPSSFESRIELGAPEELKDAQYVCKHYEWCKERNICIADVKLTLPENKVGFKANIIKAATMVSKDGLNRYDSQKLVKLEHSSSMMKHIHDQFGQKSARAGVSMNQFEKMENGMDTNRYGAIYGDENPMTARVNFDTASTWNSPVKNNQYSRYGSGMLKSNPMEQDVALDAIKKFQKNQPREVIAVEEDKVGGAGPVTPVASSIVVRDTRYSDVKKSRKKGGFFSCLLCL